MSVVITELPKSVAIRLGRDPSVIRLTPHVGYMGLVLDPKVRGKRKHVMGGKVYRIVGCGGLVWEQGMCWLWLGDVDAKRAPAVTVVRMAKNMLDRAKQLGERTVYAARDEFPNSAKLLTLVGFKKLPDHPALDGRELWAWPT